MPIEHVYCKGRADQEGPSKNLPVSFAARAIPAKIGGLSLIFEVTFESESLPRFPAATFASVMLKGGRASGSMVAHFASRKGQLTITVFCPRTIPVSSILIRT